MGLDLKVNRHRKYFKLLKDCLYSDKISKKIRKKITDNNHKLLYRSDFIIDLDIFLKKDINLVIKPDIPRNFVHKSRRTNLSVVVPNTIHFIFDKERDGINISFITYLAIKSAFILNRSKVYLHCMEGISPEESDLFNEVRDIVTINKVSLPSGISGKDIKDYEAFGADHYSVSSLCFNPIMFLKVYWDFTNQF